MKIERERRLEAALRGLLSRDDFWQAATRAGIVLPGELDDCADALADEDAGGGDDRTLQERDFEESDGSVNYAYADDTPPQRRDALEKLSLLASWAMESVSRDRVGPIEEDLCHALTEPAVPSDRGDALEALEKYSEFAEAEAGRWSEAMVHSVEALYEQIKAALTAPPTVPEAVRRLPSEWRNECCGDAGMQRCADELDRALAQSGEGRVPDDMLNVELPVRVWVGNNMSISAGVRLRTLLLALARRGMPGWMDQLERAIRNEYGAAAPEPDEADAQEGE